MFLRFGHLVAISCSKTFEEANYVSFKSQTDDLLCAQWLNDFSISFPFVCLN